MEKMNGARLAKSYQIEAEITHEDLPRIVNE
jgi:hypothetical protein